MEGAPLLDQFYRFSYRSLFTAVLLLPPLLQARLHPAIRLSNLPLLASPLEAHHDYLRLQVISRDAAGLFGPNFGQRHEGVGIGVVDGDLMVFERAELREESGEVDCFFRGGDLHIQQQRLLRLFLLENKSARPVLGPTLAALCNRLNFRQLNLHSKKYIFIENTHINRSSTHSSLPYPAQVFTLPVRTSLLSVPLFFLLQSSLRNQILTEVLPK